MVYLRKKDKDGEEGNKRGTDDGESPPNKRTRRSAMKKDSPDVEKPAPTSSRTPEAAATQMASKEHTDTPIPKHETPAKRQSLRSSHLLVTPAPGLVTPRRSRRLSTDSTDNLPQVLTPTRCSKRLSSGVSDKPPQVQTPIRRSRRLSTDLTENPPEVQTPTRQSRRLSTDLTENPPQLQTPTRRSRRLSTDLTENPPPQLQTPTRQSRRLSTDLTENPTQTQTATKRTRRLSTDVTDASCLDQKQTPSLSSSGKDAKDAADAPRTGSRTHIEVLANRSKILASDISKSPAPKVQTPTRRSRRLSTDLVDIPEDDQTPAESDTPARKSRRLSGKGTAEPEYVCDKPLFVVEEVEEEKDEESDFMKSDSATKSLAVKDTEEKEKDTELEIIEEEEDEVTEVTEKEQCRSNTSNLSKASDTIEEIADDIEILPSKQIMNEAQKRIEDEEDIKLVLEEETTDIVVQGENVNALEKNSSAQTIDSTLNENRESLTSKESPSKDFAGFTTASDALPVRPETSNKKEKENTQDKETVAGSVATVTDVKDKEPLENQENQPLAETENIKPAVNNITKQKSHNNNEEELKVSAVRGKPVSGRWWKKENKRFTSIMKDQGVKSSWAVKMQRKQELKDMLTMKTAIVEEKKRKKAELRERQKLNTIRREENARKSEIVQVIKDSRKIKKMKRKQLRYIETRDTTLLKKA